MRKLLLFILLLFAAPAFAYQPIAHTDVVPYTNGYRMEARSTSGWGAGTAYQVGKVRVAKIEDVVTIY